MKENPRECERIRRFCRQTYFWQGVRLVKCLLCGRMSLILQAFIPIRLRLSHLFGGSFWIRAATPFSTTLVETQLEDV